MGGVEGDYSGNPSQYFNSFPYNPRCEAVLADIVWGGIAYETTRTFVTEDVVLMPDATAVIHRSSGYFEGGTNLLEPITDLMLVSVRRRGEFLLRYEVEGEHAAILKNDKLVFERPDGGTLSRVVYRYREPDFYKSGARESWSRYRPIDL